MTDGSRTAIFAAFFADVGIAIGEFDARCDAAVIPLEADLDRADHPDRVPTGDETHPADTT